MTQLAERQQSSTLARVDASIMESVIVAGDLALLSPAERVSYYMKVCESVGLNPLSKPFDYIKLNNKLTLYALKTTTDQLRQIHGVSIVSTEKELLGDVYLVTAHARTVDGREDSDIGAVAVKGLQGENLANAYMKALTKAKRRVTLSICGLGWLDETEVGSIPTAQTVQVDIQTGEVRPQQESKPGRSQDVTREVAQAAGLQPQQAPKASQEAEMLASATSKLKAMAERVAKVAGQQAVDDVLSQYAWETVYGASVNCYTDLINLGKRVTDEQNRAAQQPVPLDIDNGLEPVQAVAMISPERLKVLQTAYSTKLKLSGPADRHDFAGWLLNLDGNWISSTKDLTEEQATFLIDTIGSWDDNAVEQSLAEFRNWQATAAPF